MALQAPSLPLQPWGLLSCSLTGPDPPEGLVTATVCPSPGSCRLASSLPTRHHTCTPAGLPRRGAGEEPTLPSHCPCPAGHICPRLLRPTTQVPCVGSTQHVGVRHGGDMEHQTPRLLGGMDAGRGTRQGAPSFLPVTLGIDGRGA